MQSADPNENIQQIRDDSVVAVDKESHITPLQKAEGEQNEVPLSKKVQPLSWRSNGFIHNKEPLQESERIVDNRERNPALSTNISWRSNNNKDDPHGQNQLTDVTNENYAYSSQQKKISTRTFERNYMDTDAIREIGSVNLQVAEKGLLRNNNNQQNNRDISAMGRSNQRHQTNTDKPKVTPLAHLLLSEDMRISKILRRLLNENNSSNAADLCQKLEAAVRSPENATYICRSFEYLTESMITVLKQCPDQCTEHASKILGLIGYINRSDFPIYKNYIIKNYQTCKTIQKYLMMALKTTFSCDAVNLHLIVYSDRVLVVLKDYLENADKAENFIAVSDTIAEFSKHYKRSFQKHFTDIVDIIVGWHLEVEQPQFLKIHCSIVLQQLSQYFVQKMDFTFGLLGQFLEDIASFGEKAELSVGSFVGAFNSVLKSLATAHDFIAFRFGRPTLQQAMIIITQATKQCLSHVCCQEIIINYNEFFCLIFANSLEGVNIADVIEVIILEIKQFKRLEDDHIASLLLLLIYMIRQLRTCTPIPLVTLVLSSENNILASLKCSQNEKNFKLLLKIYHEILMLKNVPLLQEAYRHIIIGVSKCILAIEAQDVRKSKVQSSRAQAECILNFYLAALSVLATQTSSIIGMYALNPSILELLIVNCQAANIQLWSHYSSLHSALLQLITVHCQKNHNYRISSRLLCNSQIFPQPSIDDATTNSPTSQNFSLILQFLAKILNDGTNLPEYNLSILLQWTATLLEECKEHSQILKDNPDFVSICKSLCSIALQAPLQSVTCLEILIKYPNINREILMCLREAAIYLIKFTDFKVSATYLILFTKLPLNISLDFSRSTDTGVISQRQLEIQELGQWYMSTSHPASLRDKYFKIYIDKLSLTDLKESPFPSTSFTEFVQSIFAGSWVSQQRENSIAYQRVASKTSQLLNAWLQHEASYYCVRNKLRTTIGKPQETFLKIEAIIMQYARILAMKESLKGEEGSLESLSHVQSCARHLLGFLECLEKHIYNASEGTAFALPSLEKPAKTFFRVNASTCNEWFKRIRTAVNLIAIHTMEPEMVVRYSEVILKNLCKSEKYNEHLMDHTIMSLVWALLRCRESDTLQGLYNWVKAKTGKRYLWIKYVADQAAGHKEQAAEGYLYIFNEHESRMDSYIKEFLTDQLLDCLYYTNQWHQLREFLIGARSVKRETIALSCANNFALLNTMEMLYCSYTQPSAYNQFHSSLLELMQWTDSANLVGSSGSANTFSEGINFSYYTTMQKLESLCLVGIIDSPENSVARLIPSVKVLHQGLRECIQQRNSLDSTQLPEFLTDFIILSHVAQKQFDMLGSSDATHVSNEFNCSEVIPDSTALLKCLRWSWLFELRSIGHNKPREKTNCSLFLDVAASARREGNKKLCSSELSRFFALKGLNEALPDISFKVQNQALIVDIGDSDLLRGYCELAKCMFLSSSNQEQLDAINLAAAYCRQIIEQVSLHPQRSYPHTSADMLLTLSEWLLQRSNTAVASVNTTHLRSLLSNLANALDSHSDASINEIIPPYDMTIGRLIRTSINQNDKAGEAWYAFGNWCYRWGKKLVESKTDCKSVHKAGLSQRDMEQIKETLEGVENAENIIEDIVSILNCHQVNANDDEEIEANEISSTELIESQLRKISSLNDKPAHIFTAIIKIWRQAHKSIYTYYEMAAEAYFKYLCIGTNDNGTKRNSCAESSSTFVTATLRLLRLVVKHAFGLQEVFEEGLSNTPARPWQIIIPQLFSRLNHHEPYVRKRVSELLCRVAEGKPHIIIFPAVVGSQQEEKARKDSESCTFKESEEKTMPLSTCYSALLSTLSKQAPETVNQVQLLVRELKRVTLLWDEYWIHSLAQLYGEYSALFSAFEAESKKATEINVEALRAKHSILMRHVVADLRKISAVTEKAPETNYERNFQERYQTFIQNTITELDQPLNVAKPNESWQRIKHLYSVFQQRALRTSASTLRMNDISPILASMCNTAISMPGVESVDGRPVYIKAVDNIVYILPTKTKPKKLAFFGSDGRKYTYLFKGFEDLHLDERIMQFLSISNSMMARSNDTASLTNCYKAHHYSVIPLGPQSGLISWVDGVTPLFAIYKKWQQRDALVKQQQKERSTSTSSAIQQSGTSVAPAAVRPSELFYNKLAPLLAEQNIKITDTRKHWPLSTLRRVLEELTKETPCDLLSKELWCHASNAADWRRSVRNYSLSVAVMSVIGYVIGLGDRHLDNVLVKLSSGEIIHIDYNVCFEKGKTLRVPEKIPFRMTPNLEEALGITGVEGTFRLGCEHVLKILRKERETLLTLLEAFVYDPLVDWTVGDDGTTTSTHTTTAMVAAADIAALKLTVVAGGAANVESETSGLKHIRQDLLTPQRKQNDTDITRTTINLRLSELKPYWIQYKEEATIKLQEIASHIKELEQNTHDIQHAENERDSLTKQLAMIRELETLGSAMDSHPLNTISQRYASYKKSAEEFNCIKQSVNKCYKDLRTIANIYFDQLLNAATHGSEMARLRIQLREYQQTPCANEFELVRELLGQSAQEQLFNKSDFARKEMDNTVSQQARAAQECIDLLQQYARIMRFYPRTKLIEHRLVLYIQWYRDLLDETREGSALTDELQQFVEKEKQIDEETKLKVIQYSKALETLWIELNFDLHKSANSLGEQQQKVAKGIPVEHALNSIQAYIEKDKVNNPRALQLAMLETITKTNDSFISFEEASLSRTNEDTFILDQQIDYIDMLLIMYKAAFPESTAASVVYSYNALQTLQSYLQALYEMKAGFHVDLPERIMKLFMLNNDTELQVSLDMLCADIVSSENYKNILSKISNIELEDLLAEIDELFDECGKRLNSLSDLMQDILNQTPDGHVKQFVLSIYCYDFEPLSSKYKTISHIFQTIRTQVDSLQTNNLEQPYNARLLNVPVLEFLNSMQQSFVTGLTSLLSFSLLHNLQKTLDTNVETYADNVAEAINLSNAKTLCQNLFVALQQKCTLKHSQMQVHFKTKAVEHCTFVATAHFWANECYLCDSQLNYGHIIHKEKLLLNVQNTSQALKVWKLTMTKIQAEIDENATAISQRLKWAVGANQNLSALQESFHNSVKTQDACYRFHLQTAVQLIEYSNALIQFELLKSYRDSSALEADCAFLKAVTQWQDSLNNFRHQGNLITLVEQSIVQLLDPEGKVDQCWINNISGLLDEMTFATQRQLVEFERIAQNIQENIYECGQQLQTLMDSQMRVDIRHLLKSIAKMDSSQNFQTHIDKTSSPLSARIREFQHAHKQFFTQLNDLQMKIISRDFAEDVLKQLDEQIRQILQNLNDNYTDLLDLVQSFIQNDFNCNSPIRTFRATAESLTNINTNGSSNEKRAIVASQREQKRNAYAVSVWKRIRMKLEGRDPDPNRRSTVAEQIDFIIREAMNPDNLAVLYEGWTPWV